MRRPHRLLPIAILTALAWTGGPASTRADYLVTNLVSDIAGLAATTDLNLKNPWGVSYNPAGGPFWVSDQATNKSTLYTGTGSIVPLVVSIPTTGDGPQGPTGQVWNGNAADFHLANGNAAKFLFANLNGQISGWNGGSTAQVVASGAGAVYTGLAIAQVGGDNVIYAADAAGKKIDVYDSNFKMNPFASTGFQDARLTGAGFSVYNVQTLGGQVYVTYGNQSNGANAATNGGAVAVYDLVGHLLRDFSNGPGGPLEDPWGLTVAPSSFGRFGGDLLVGNNENGQINAFDPITGAFLGNVTTITGTDPSSTNNGLWGLTFGNNGNGGRSDTLYAFAGINNEKDGLVAAISSVPEPGSALLVAVGGAVAIAFGRGRRSPKRG